MSHSVEIKIGILEGIWFVCEEQVHDHNPQWSDGFSKWGKFPRRHSWVAGYIFSAEEFCTAAVLQESKTYATEKSDVHQGFQVLCPYLVDILWFAVDQFRILVFYCCCFGLEYTYITCFYCI